VIAWAPSGFDAFAFFQPHVTLTADDRARLDSGAAIVKSLAAGPGEVAIFSAVRADIGGDRLVAWVRHIEALKKSTYVTAIRRFSRPPALADVASLDLDDSELDDLRRCRPGSCGLKLSEAEIQELAPIARAGRPGWRAAARQAFREAIVARARQYEAGGLAALPPYRDQSDPVAPGAEFDSILANASFLPLRLPALTEVLVKYPAVRNPDVESFLYWSREQLGGKPIVSITHVAIARPDDAALPEAVVAARQVYAAHYMSGSLAVTTIVGGRDGTPRYLAYLNRSRVDVLDGFFGGLVRRIIERRLRNEAGQVVDGLRRRLLAGEPPLR
jgi:hypothetical protein